MVPKIVTRLANIAAKMAGSDKYDPTVEPVTAFEYYLDKAADKILAIKGVPASTSEDRGYVLTVDKSGVPVWMFNGKTNIDFSGTTEAGDAFCSVTWNEYVRLRNYGVFYEENGELYQLNEHSTFSSSEFTYQGLPDPNNPTAGYKIIKCTINNRNEVTCVSTNFIPA